MCEVSPDCSVDLRPFFTFYGGKWRSAPLYPEPKYGTIVEPFAGSAGYSMRYHWLNVILIEIDPAIAEVWRYLIKVSSSEILSLPNLNNGDCVDDLIEIPEEAKLLIGWWCGRGRAQPGRTISGWGKDNQYAKYFWGPVAKERIANQVDHIKHWEVINDSYKSVDPFLATWFVDPPYSSQGHCYRFGSHTVNYDDLALWCGSLQGQIIVCEGSLAKWFPFEKFTCAQSNNGYKSEEYMFHAEL